jgi:transposase-like protein
MVNIRDLIDHAKCHETVRTMRWPDRVTRPHCSSDSVIKDGKVDTEPQRQRHLCRGCGRRFDDLTGTIFAGRHEPLQTWIICLYFMGLNLSRLQIAADRAEAAAEGGAGSGDAGEGEAADLRDDPADRRGRDPDAGERPAGHDRTAHPWDDRRGKRCLYRLI